MASTVPEPSRSPSDVTTPPLADRGIGSHGGQAMAEATGHDAVGPDGVVVHRAGYRPRHLGPVPGVGLERPQLAAGVLEEEAAGHLRVAAWRQQGEPEETSDLGRLRELVAEPGTRLWVDLTDATRALVAEVADALEIHPLVAEDIAERGQRPKLELTGDEAHLVVYSISYGEKLVASEIDIVLARRYLLTSHEGRWDPLQTHHLRLGPMPLLSRGVDYLAWGLIDSLVDSYYPIFDAIDEEIDTLEDEIIESADKSKLARLLEIKRTLVEIRHVVSPMREVFNQLTNRELGLVQPETILYFRDVYDHLIRLNDELDSYRDLASGILDVYLSTINNNLSLIMKRLTGVTVILAGIGAVGGLFGMSEAGAALNGGEHSGFWIVTGVVLAGAGLVALLLRRIDWI
jgi:magnesium transporter